MKSDRVEQSLKKAIKQVDEKADGILKFTEANEQTTTELEKRVTKLESNLSIVPS